MPVQSHPHKAVLVYAAHQGTLQSSFFRLLACKAQFDNHLASFLDSAFSSLQQELFAVQSYVVKHEDEADLPDVDVTLAALASMDDHQAFDKCKIALTTIAHVATAIGARDDFRKALSGTFAAIWDPESALAVHLLQLVDVSDVLQVLKSAQEAVRLACWLDFFLCQHKSTAHRILVQGDEQDLAAVRQFADSNGLPMEDTLQGLVLCVFCSVQVDKIRSQATESTTLLVTTISTLPVFSNVQAEQFLDHLKELMLARGIDYPLTTKTTGVDLVSTLIASPSYGQSLQHLHLCMEIVKQSSRCATLFGPQVSLLIFAQARSDLCTRQITGRLTAIDLDSVPVQLRHFLYAKDSTRYGDEPVKLSAVEGNPCQQIAIIGMSCRLPGAKDAEDLYALLQNGGNLCRKIPDSLYNYEDYHSKSYRDRNVMRVTTGNFVSDPRLFDRTLLPNATLQDCQQMDPQQRVALLTTFETLQQAGYGFSTYKAPLAPHEWSSHIAYCSDDYREHLSHDIQPQLVAGTQRGYLTARINDTFGFKGDACTYDTACSSALVAIEAACNSLLSGATSSAITGGVNILTQPSITIGLDRGFFLSAASQCMTLDDAGAGYSRADAVSLMLLKRLPDAVRDGDPILALISSAATNHSGESFSITHPHGPTQERLYRSGMLASNSLPEQFSYIEMHGTGTQAGDFEEVSGIVHVFGKDTRPDKAPLVLGSVKANIGHSEATSGASSIIKTLKIYENGTVPKHIGISTKLNTKLPLLDGLQIPYDATPLPNVDRSHTLVDNFSAAGGNSSIVLDKGARYTARLSQKDNSEDDTATSHPHLLFVTAANSFSLDAKRRRLIAFLDENPTVSLREFCSAVSLSDPMFQLRLLATPSSISEVKACLGGQESITLPTDRSAAPRIGFAFSGQGSQYLDMGRELYEHSPGFRAHIDRCGVIASSLQLPDLVGVLRPSPAMSENPTAPRTVDSFSPAQFQLALVAIEIGLASMLTDWGIQPVAVVGHSLGEYTALWMARVLSLRDVLALVGARATLMMEFCESHASSMLAIRDGSAKVQSLLRGSGLDGLEIACLNSPTDTVVAGRTVDIEKLRVLCDTSNPKIKAMAIPVPYAFHSQAVEMLMEPYADVLSKYRLQPPKLPLASNVLGDVVQPGSPGFDQDYLVRHLRQPVRFFEAITALQRQENVDHWIDLGPHPTCVPMLKGCYADQTQQPIFMASLRRGSSSWQCMLNLVIELASHGVELTWKTVWEDLGLTFPNSLLAPKLPLYAFDLEEYWIPFKDRNLRDHLMEKAVTKDVKLNSTASKVKRKAINGKPHRHAKPVHALLSSCVDLSVSPPSAKFLSKVNQAPFRDFIHGHIILGVPLAPATVFVELAQEAGHYWWQAANESSAPAAVVMEVLDLSMVASLYLDDANPDQSLEVSLQGDPRSTDGCNVQFFSHSQQQHQKHQFGSCRVRAIATPALDKEWGKMSHLIQAAAKGVKAQPDSVLKLDTVYSLFETIVLYKGGFRGMTRVWMTDEGGEAVSLVKYNPQAVSSNYLCSPMLLDSLGGLTGFISNVAFAEDKWIYMAEAIGRVVTTAALGALKPGSDTRIHVYARMQQSGELSTGSAYFFGDDGELMGMMEGIVFKKIRRDVLARLVQMSSKAFAEEANRNAELTVATPKPAIPIKVAPVHTPTQTQCRYDAPVPPHHIGGPRVKEFSTRPTLFLFPEGSGRAQSYPRLDQASISIYGFESPYLGQAKDWSRGFPQLIERYVEMLYNVQPRGPYRLGGWSIGGIIAIEVTRQLLSAGQEVVFLGLIDTPGAALIKPLSSQTLEGMLARISSFTVREHFRSCALSLPNYRCLPFQHDDKKPKTIAIVNATDHAGMEGLMSTQDEWCSFFSDSVVYREVTGDHWTCVETAMHNLDTIAGE